MRAPSTSRLREQLEANQGALIRAAERHGATNVRVFGSVARGDDGPDSDVDLLVDMEKDRSLLDLAALTIELSQMLECEVDVVTPGGLRPHIRERVVSEAVPLPL